MDNVDRKTRSRVMASVRSKGNRSTEVRLRACLVRSGLRGWRMHADDLPGKPDFVFDEAKLAIFVDGCFWHSCPLHCRLPKSRKEYWHTKIANNRKRDKKNSHELRRMGWRVVRIWEHRIKTDPMREVRRIKVLAGQ